jgi:hypothetical protein
VRLDIRFVAPGYFDVLGIPVKEGRVFGESAESAGAVINERAARELWPGRSPIGRRIVGLTSGDTIVGVVGDVRHTALDGEPVAELYVRSRDSQQLTYVVRTSGSPAALARTVQAAVEGAAPVRLAEILTFDERVTRSVSVPQFRARLFGLMGLLVAGLAVVGVFSVTAYGVAERRREIGIRVALGARPGHTVRLMMGQASVPVVAGIAIGLAAAFNTNRLVAHFLFATAPTDGPTMGAVVVAVLGTALLAAYVPARRALRVDPTVALRSE